MEAIFELLLKAPTDERLLLTATGVAESDEAWPRLFSVLVDTRFQPMFMNKIYLNSLTRCLENMDFSLWDLHHLETVFVQCVPRWGSLIEKGSLGELCCLLSVFARRGLCIMVSDDPALPAGYVDSIRRLRYEILRILWFCSAIATLFQLLRCFHGEEEDSVTNILLENHKADEARRTVIEAQENAIICISSLVSVVKGCNLNDTSSGINQLKSTLSDFILAGASPSDLSSCPFLVSLCSFIIGSGKTKPPPETIDAACDCLHNILEAFDVPPSSFISAPRFRKLNERLVNALLETSTSGSMRLLSTVITQLPSIVPQDKKVACLIQDNQKMYSAASFAAETFPVSDFAESSQITSGNAYMLTRYISDKTANVETFLTKSIGNSDWIKTDLLPSRDSVDLLSNFFSFLQSIRVDASWVIVKDQVHEPTLSHFVFHATNGSSRLDKEQVIEFNSALRDYRMRQELLTSILMLFNRYLGTNPTGDVPSRVRVAILTCLADMSLVDENAVREYPEVINRLLAILLATVEQEVKLKGIALSRSGDTKSERAIIVSALLRIVPFAKMPKGMDCFVTGMRCLPHWLLDHPDDDQPNDDLYLLLEEVCRCVPAGTILRGSGNSDPIIFSTMEAMVQFIAKSPSVVACNRTIFEYLGYGIDSMGSLKSVPNPSVLVSWLSLISSVVVLQEEDSLAGSFVEKVWTILACHPAIQALASAPVWSNDQYTVEHLGWVYVLQLSTVLLPFSSSVLGIEKFLSTYKPRLTTRFTTAHTSDLASIEEACLIARLIEAAPRGSIESGSPLESPFQFTSLITYKPPGIYPRSRSEKIGGNLESIMFEDVRMACTVPCVFAQRIVWLATDIVSSGVRRIIRTFSSRTLGDDSASVLFHSLLDCSHFVAMYLKELTMHEQNVLRLVEINDNVYVPLSVYIQPGDTVPPDTAAKKEKAKENSGTSGGTGSLLNSLPSPVTKAAVLPLQPRGSLMDSLSPKNSANKTSAKKSVVFYSPRSGDCPQRAGLSFISPALVIRDDFIGKLVEVLSLCLIQAMRLATTEALVRPLLDLLMSMKSNSDKLPAEANGLVADLVDIVAPRYNSFSEERRQVAAHPQKSSQQRNPIYPTIGNITY